MRPTTAGSQVADVDRYRVQLFGDRTRESARLEDASITLSTVATSLNTVSGRAILGATMDGETNALVLADMAKGQDAVQDPHLARASEGNFDAHHTLSAKSILDRLDRVEQAMRELDQVIESACQPWAHETKLLQTILGLSEVCAGLHRRNRW